jgi:hypothetical protein
VTPVKADPGHDNLVHLGVAAPAAGAVPPGPRALRLARRLAVHLLMDGQYDIARAFTRSGTDRFADPSTWSPDQRLVRMAMTQA